MLLSYDMPTNIVPSLEGTAAWLSDDQGLALVDGRPGTATRFSWGTEAQTTSSETVIDCTWSTAIVPRVVMLLGVSLPVGMKVTVDFQQTLSWGYTSTTSAVIAMNNGTNGVVIVLPDSLLAVTGVKVHLVNNVGGATVMAASDAVDVGELWVGGAQDWEVTRTVQDDLVDPTDRRRTLGQQVFATKRLPYRKLSLDVVPVAQADVDEPSKVRIAAAQSVPAVLILETTHLASAMYGNLTSFNLKIEKDACYWTPSITFEEVPNG